MAEVGTMIMNNFSATSKHSTGLPYLPSSPPKARMSSVAMSYTSALQTAPYSALVGVVVDCRQPSRHPASPRYRIRRQVGGTNRWRLPESLGGDLLGTAQAIKSLNEPYNDSMVAVMTAENPATSINSDPERPYQFPSRDILEDRPHTTLDARTSNGWSTQRSLEPRPPGTAPCRLSSPSPIERFQPSSARSPTPVDIFHYHSAPIHSVLGPDILLQCLDTNWELHRPYIQKSSTLTELLCKAENKPHSELYYRDPMSATLDQYISKSNHYSTEYQDISHSLSMTDSPRSLDGGERRRIDHPAHIVKARTNTMTKLKLKVRDSMVTRDAFAVALGNLYHDDIDVEKCDVVGVLASAHSLGFLDLERRCADIMLRNLSSMTVCKYHQAGLKYKVGQVVNACERWLELNLIPHLSVQIQLRDLPLELLQKIIKSSRFFTFSEYYLYKLLCYWIFLQQNSHLQLMPSHSTIVTFFNSLSKTTAFVDREQGQKYAGLFRSIRLAGVTDTRHLDDMLRMNVIPQEWILKTLSMHYHALQGGGDMSLMLNFGNDAIRTGFIIEQEPRYHSEVVSIHGFHFELKAHRQGKDSTYQFYMQRLKPHDPTLSFRVCERQTFSLRQDREVLYSIRAQCRIQGQDYLFNTGILGKKFGLGSKTSKSEVLSLDGLCLPIYVTFSILFPPS
ncbi:BTB/POZ domain-containing protein 16-like [Asterias rubens]|uniref:BTB/POZ domain-containing protein 16-like n=1 Tax=Asterias rubens TaxID=7604 RepID=UPI001455BC27|nr:BTB/POZ domain-containing protein 16-like [Asterias rubens]XP_033633109.1 BTB/POZ domain-containing protein 16-like [Asterias rubens]XP_033633110.1 BTB/POZ domain-containing protein 16-like [Asterias rubens]